MAIFDRAVTGGWALGEAVLRRMVEVAVPPKSEASPVPGLALLPRALTTGTIPRLTLTLHDVFRNPFTTATITLDLEDLEVDGKAVLQRDFRISRIGSGRVTIELLPGRVSVVFASLLQLRTFAPKLEIQGGKLVLTAPGLPPLRLPIPHELVPGRPEVHIGSDRIVLTGTIPQVPEALLDAAQRARPQA